MTNTERNADDVPLNIPPGPVAEAVRLLARSSRLEHLTVLEDAAASDAPLCCIRREMLIEQFCVVLPLQHGDSYPRHENAPFLLA